MSVLAAIHQPGSEIPPDEPQEPQASVPRCLALLCLQQTVSSVQAGRAGLWPVPALSQWPAPCLPSSCARYWVNKQRSPLAGSRPTTGLGRGQWPFRALPGCPLGGGRVLILQTLGSLLALLNTQGRGFGWHSGRERKGWKWGCGLPLQHDHPLLPSQLPRAHTPHKKKANPPSVHSGASCPRGVQQPQWTLDGLAVIC